MPTNKTSFDTRLPIEFIRALVRAASSQGISVDDILDAENINFDTVKGVPISKTVKIINYLIEQSPISTIFPLFSVINDEAIVEMIAICSTSKTLVDAFENLQKHGPFSVIGISVYFEESEDQDFFCVDNSNVESTARQLLTEMATAAFVRFLPQQFKLKETMKAVEFGFSARGDLREFEYFFQCPVSFDHEVTRIALPKGIIDQEIRSYSPQMLKASVATLCEKINILKELQGISFHVCTMVRTVLSEREKHARDLNHREEALQLNADNIANRLTLTTRSLQRKLKLENERFVDLKNRTLMQESIRLIKQPNVSLEHIAELLGFSDRASFSKTFKKYEGVWPAELK